MMPPEPPLRLMGVRHVEGRLLAGERRHYRTPDGGIVRELVRHPGSVAVLPVRGSEAILLRQFRAPIERQMLEIPAGLRDRRGEDPEETARRECAEETGFQPGRLTILEKFFNSPGFADEYSWLYLGEDLEEVGSDPQGAEERAAEVVTLEWDEVRSLMSRGEIEDAKTLIALYAWGAREGRL